MKRVVITGLGIISPLGSELNMFWQLLSTGQSGIRPITRCETKGLSSTLGGEIIDFDPTDYIAHKQARRMGRASHFAVASALRAVHDARLQLELEDRSQVAVCIGTSVGGLSEAFLVHSDYLKKGGQVVNPFAMTSVFPNAVSGEVAIAVGAHGVSETYSIGCSSTANAVGRAFDLVRLGQAQIAVAGGTEAPFHHVILSAMEAGRMMADDAGGTIRNLPRPFDRSRCGMVIGEGAGCLILEDYEHAVARGAHIYAEIDGWSFTCDALSMAKPDATGKEHARAIQRTLSESHWFPEEVDYINACGLGTIELDAIETSAIKQSLGTYSYKVPVTSFKASLGHAFAASGAFQLIGTALIMQHQFIPPTVNWMQHDDACDLDYVGGVGRPARVDHALVNSFGFGGKNIVLGISGPNQVMRRMDPGDGYEAERYRLSAERQGDLVAVG